MNTVIPKHFPRTFSTKSIPRNLLIQNVHSPFPTPPPTTYIYIYIYQYLHLTSCTRTDADDLDDIKPKKKKVTTAIDTTDANATRRASVHEPIQSETIHRHSKLRCAWLNEAAKQCAARYGAFAFAVLTHLLHTHCGTDGFLSLASTDACPQT